MRNFHALSEMERFALFVAPGESAFKAEIDEIKTAIRRLESAVRVCKKREQITPSACGGSFIDSISGLVERSLRPFEYALNTDTKNMGFNHRWNSYV